MSDPYIKGFNEGYVIAAHLPELGDGLSKIESASPWAEGFRDGRKHYLLEHLSNFLSAPPAERQREYLSIPMRNGGMQERDGGDPDDGR
jgi:hypothetical protein